MFQLVPGFQNKVILPIANDWLVGWLVNLTKFAKIAITESIWLILGVDVPKF